ncbi:unnamed protein product [Leuciscus chuanchicus]
MQGQVFKAMVNAADAQERPTDVRVLADVQRGGGVTDRVAGEQVPKWAGVSPLESCLTRVSFIVPECVRRTFGFIGRSKTLRLRHSPSEVTDEVKSSPRQAFQVPGQRDRERVSAQAFIKDFGPRTSQELTGISAME